MKPILLAALLAGALSLPALAQQDKPADHGAHHPAAEPAAASADKAEGEVRKIDKGNAKLTLKHGEIRNLEMPPMTMVFRVKDAALLEQVKEGDKIRFTTDKVGGQYTVTGIEPAR